MKKLRFFFQAAYMGSSARPAAEMDQTGLPRSIQKSVHFIERQFDQPLTVEKVAQPAGAYTTSTIDFYLADFTSADSGDWYIVDDWTYVEMMGLGDIIGFEIDFSGSQATSVPAYVAMDNLNAVPVPAAVWMLGSGLVGLVAMRRRNQD